MILDADPITGIVERFHWNPETEEATITTEQHVTDNIEHAKALYNSVDERARYREGFNHVAHIPGVLYMELYRKGIARDEKAFKKWLEDPDNRFFRTRPGRV